VQTYSSPPAFKQALEQRLKTASNSGVDFARRRQLLVFDRFLARVVAVLGDAVLLKGGLVLELRLERARTTKDIDLRLTGSPETVLAKLQLSLSPCGLRGCAWHPVCGASRKRNLRCRNTDPRLDGFRTDGRSYRQLRQGMDLRTLFTPRHFVRPHVLQD
jgi:hypothetical protein